MIKQVRLGPKVWSYKLNIKLCTLMVRPFEAFSGPDFFFWGGEGYSHNILGAISLGRLVESSLKIIINLPRTVEKLLCEGGPYRFSGLHIIVNFNRRRSRTQKGVVLQNEGHTDTITYRVTLLREFH